MFSGVYFIPCESQNTLKNIAFYIGDYKYEIEPVNYRLQVCASSIIRFPHCWFIRSSGATWGVPFSFTQLIHRMDETSMSSIFLRGYSVGSFSVLISGSPKTSGSRPIFIRWTIEIFYNWVGASSMGSESPPRFQQKVLLMPVTISDEGLLKLNVLSFPDWSWSSFACTC